MASGHARHNGRGQAREHLADPPNLTPTACHARRTNPGAAAASMLAGQDSESATDLVFRWGAMGHDGYQQTPTPTTVVMAAQGKPYDFQAGGFYSLDANAIICANQSPFSGAHSDIRHPEVLWAVVSAAGLAD